MSTVREVLPAFGTPWIHPWGAVSPDRPSEVAQFVFRLGEVQLFIYDRYDIVEIVTDFTWTAVPEIEKEEALLF